MDMHELLNRYETLGDEHDFAAAKPLYEQALAGGEEPRLLLEYGYLHQCHAARELRRAVELYERAAELDPGYDKPHYQLITARAALREPERAVSLYEKRVAAAPDDVRERRFLAHAYVAAHAYAPALATAEGGLALAPEDAALLAARGEAKAGLGDAEGALADWRCALDLDPDDIGGLYSTAFLLEREGRLDEAVEAWRAIVAWSDERGYAGEAVWPRQELTRLLEQGE